MSSKIRNNSSEIFFLPKKEIIVSNTQDPIENDHDTLDIEIGIVNNIFLGTFFSFNL